MNQRRMLVLIDGAASSSQAVQVFLNEAGPPAVTSITCLFVDPSTEALGMPFPALLGLPEWAFAGGGTLSFVDGPPAADARRRAVAVLEELQIRASGRGLQFSGKYSARIGDKAIFEYCARFDVVVDCRPPRASPTRNVLNPVLRRLLSRGRQPVVLAHSGRGEVHRVVLATRADRYFDDLCHWGTDCAKRLKVPLTVVSAARTARRLARQLRRVESTLETLGIDGRVRGFHGQTRELAASFCPTDLLLVNTHARHWPLPGYLSAELENLLLRARCLTGVLPVRRGAARLSRLVNGSAIRDSIDDRQLGCRPFTDSL